VSRLLHLISSVAMLVVLALMPPTLPDFGPSLATPLTTSTLARLALLLLWIVCLALALVLLQRALFPTRILRPPAWAAGASSRRRHRQWQIPPKESAAPRLIFTTPVGDAPPRVLGEADPTEAAATDETPILAATIALLGPVRIEGVRRPRRATTVELLAYLALHPDGASRDQLLEAMWPNEDPRRTRPRLWQSVSEARRLLGDAFEHDGDRYRLDRAHVAVDADELEQLLARIDAAPVGDVGPLVERALKLWRGEPFSGTDYAWADGDIRQLEAALAKLAEQAARVRHEAGDPQGALRVAEQGLRFDDLNETFVRIALEADAALGRRGAVTERYETLREQLDDRLGLQPERATRALYRELLGEQG
jgi:DNA-binding SARP family transcriptional activator